MGNLFSKKEEAAPAPTNIQGDNTAATVTAVGQDLNLNGAGQHVNVVAPGQNADTNLGSIAFKKGQSSSIDIQQLQQLHALQ